MSALRFVHKAATLLVLAVGVVHTLGTFYFFEALEESAIWFSGAGLGAIFVAFLNLGLWGNPPGARMRWPVNLANILFAGWLFSGALATPQPPSFVVAAVGVTMALSGLLLPRPKSTPPGENQAI